MKCLALWKQDVVAAGAQFDINTAGHVVEQLRGEAKVAIAASGVDHSCHGSIGIAR